MKRALVVGLGAALVLCAMLTGAFVVLRPPAVTPLAARSAPAAIESAALPRVARVVPPPKGARFSRAVYATTSMPGSGPLLDLCRGPVAIDLGATRPLLVAEHDYCGGSAWIPRLEEGDTVDLSGKGVGAGLYVVTDIAYGQRRVARFSDLPDATVVLQTCISETKIVMVGLDPASSLRAS